jgi:hypothetical protein
MEEKKLLDSEAQLPPSLPRQVNRPVVYGESLFSPVHKPVFIFIMGAIIWGFYLHGLLNSHLLLSDASPPESSNLWFHAIKPYPTCTDDRRQVWRLLTNQVHLNIFCVHI